MIVISNTLETVLEMGDGPGATNVSFISEVTGTVVVDVEKHDLIEAVTVGLMDEGGELDEDICAEVLVKQWSLDRMELVDTEKFGQCLRLTLSVEDFEER